MTSPLRLMLIDEDPVFRLGLKIWLEQSTECVVVAQADQAEDALAQLAARSLQNSGFSEDLAGDRERRGIIESLSEEFSERLLETIANEVGAEPSATAGPTDRSATALPDLDLVILDLGLGAGAPDRLPGLQLCADIKARYPTLPVLVLSSRLEPVLQAAARQMGADGYGARGMAVRELAQLIRTLARSEAAMTPEGLAPAVPRETPLTPSDAGPLAVLKDNLRRSSLRQIEATLAEVVAQQRSSGSNWLEDLTLAGRRRELQAARWLINRLLATPDPNLLTSDITPAEPGSEPTDAAYAGPELPSTAAGPSLFPRKAEGSLAESQALTAADRRSLVRGDLQSIVFESVFRKLQGPLENQSGLPLETDILREEKKRELLYLILRQLEDALDELRQSRLLPGQLIDTCPEVLRDVWQAVTTDFLGRYYMLEVGDLEQPVVKTLLQEEAVVRSALLDKIPQVPMLLGHILFQEAVVVDGAAFVATTPEALTRSRILLENLLLQLANAVMQPLLNRFAEVEEIKKYLYQRRLMSTRDIERFRNDLSWRYRWDSLINEPKAIFESQHRLLILNPQGIQTQWIYAPRQEELEQLSGLQLTVTLAIEARDAIAPRLRSTISLVGSGLVYLLTDVVGRGIGLIGRGIIKGVGSAWSDPKYRRKG